MSDRRRLLGRRRPRRAPGEVGGDQPAGATPASLLVADRMAPEARTAPIGAHASARAPRHAFARRWFVAGVLLVAICWGWGLASPVPSGPDEMAHVVKAAAVSQGVFTGDPGPAAKPATLEVRVPGTITSAARRGICDYRITRSAACTEITRASSRLVAASTYVARYPPLYYAVVGLPLVFTSATWTVTAMRLIDGLVVGVLLGLAFAVTATWGTGLRMIALGIVVTPTVLSLGGVVNPNGMEVAGAVVVWAALCCLVFDRPHDPPTAAVVAAVVGSVALCSSRSLSTLFLAVILGAVVVVRPGACRRLLAHRRVKLGVVVGGAVAVASAGYVLVERSYEVESFRLRAHLSALELGIRLVGRTSHLVTQLVGGFGSPNFFVPSPDVVGWVGAVAALLAWAVVVASRRDAVALVLVVLVVGFALPFAITYSHARVDGLAWQGRYSLPLAAGVPLLAAALVDETLALGRARLRRIAGGAAVGLAAGWISGFYWYLRRYTVGLAPGNLNAFASGGVHWLPAPGAPALFATVAAASAALAGWTGRESARARSAVEPAPVGVPAGHPPPVPVAV